MYTDPRVKFHKFVVHNFCSAHQFLIKLPHFIAIIHVHPPGGGGWWRWGGY